MVIRYVAGMKDVFDQKIGCIVCECTKFKWNSGWRRRRMAWKEKAKSKAMGKLMESVWTPAALLRKWKFPFEI